MNIASLISTEDLRGPQFEPAFDALVAALAAGAPGIGLLGPPGCGKTMFARRVTSVLPAMTAHEQRWLQIEYAEFLGSTVGYTILERPFRAPHHTISGAGLFGTPWRGIELDDINPLCECGRIAPAHPWHQLPRHIVPPVSELQLARFGVLLLDEIDEFRLAALEGLTSKLRNMTGRPFIIATANTWDATGEHSARFGERLAMLGISHVAHIAGVHTSQLQAPIAPGPSAAAIRARIEAAR